VMIEVLTEARLGVGGGKESEELGDEIDQHESISELRGMMQAGLTTGAGNATRWKRGGPWHQGVNAAGKRR
jgi:hypothetical protein